jgi:hypothetical protein
MQRRNCLGESFVVRFLCYFESYWETSENIFNEEWKQEELLKLHPLKVDNNATNLELVSKTNFRRYDGQQLMLSSSSPF